MSDFIDLIKRIINDYDVLIFATVVYWYALRGIMKIFFDKTSGLPTIEKPLGRRLRNKHIAVTSSSDDDNLGDDFWLPFKKSSIYLGMKYITDLHTFQDNLAIKEILEFKNRIEEHTS